MATANIGAIRFIVAAKRAAMPAATRRSAAAGGFSIRCPRDSPEESFGPEFERGLENAKREIWGLPSVPEGWQPGDDDVEDEASLA